MMIFGKLFRRKEKKPPCRHRWHHVKDDYISINRYNSVDLEDACWIVCSNCETDRLVYKEEWERLRKRQEILEANNSQK